MYHDKCPAWTHHHKTPYRSTTSHVCWHRTTCYQMQCHKYTHIRMHQTLQTPFSTALLTALHQPTRFTLTPIHMHHGSTLNAVLSLVNVTQKKGITESQRHYRKPEVTSIVWPSLLPPVTGITSLWSRRTSTGQNGQQRSIPAVGSCGSHCRNCCDVMTTVHQLRCNMLQTILADSSTTRWSSCMKVQRTACRLHHLIPTAHLSPSCWSAPKTTHDKGSRRNPKNQEGPHWIWSRLFYWRK